MWFYYQLQCLKQVSFACIIMTYQNIDTVVKFDIGILEITESFDFNMRNIHAKYFCNSYYQKTILKVISLCFLPAPVILQSSASMRRILVTDHR